MRPSCLWAGLLINPEDLKTAVAKVFCLFVVAQLSTHYHQQDWSQKFNRQLMHFLLDIETNRTLLQSLHYIYNTVVGHIYSIAEQDIVPVFELP